MKLLDMIKKYKIISIIGMGKNVGKTTTLNHIIRNFKGNLGITSIGRDGEKYDVITRLPKPRIYIEKGTYVATAEQSLDNSIIKMELIKTTGFNTPLGVIKILKSMSSSNIELAGPSINKYLWNICLELINLGCDIILVDGAFDRRSYASPLISDATILSTGASISEDIHKVVDLTAHTVKLLTIENEKEEEILKLANEIFQNSKIGIIDSKNSIKMLDIVTSLDAARDIIENLNSDSKYVAIKGPITDKLLNDLMDSTEKYKGVTFLVEDGTKLFLSKGIMERFQKKGGILKVLNPIKLIAVTANPTSPFGYEFDKNEFLKLLKENINIPIYDLGPND
ncbi:hypothetical protein ES706_03540 [subsurface metagenome]